jgi:antirestriction protein ArdC
MSSFDLYQTVTDQIVAMLESGVVPWRSPILGRSKAGHPKNLNTGRQYRGVNVFLLEGGVCGCELQESPTKAHKKSAVGKGGGEPSPGNTADRQKVAARQFESKPATGK